MKKIQIILLVIIIIGLGLIFTQKFWVDRLVDFIIANEKGVVLKNDPFNTTYTISGKEYQLVNGKVENESVKVFGEPVYADLDKDGDLDAVMYLTQETGGSGTFFYIVIAINDDSAYKGTEAMLLGDRIAPQNINIIDGRAVANFAERKVGEPMTTQPSIGKSVWIHYDSATGKIGEWVKDFEGESNI